MRCWSRLTGGFTVLKGLRPERRRVGGYRACSDHTASAPADAGGAGMAVLVSG